MKEKLASNVDKDLDYSEICEHRSIIILITIYYAEYGSFISSMRTWCPQCPAKCPVLLAFRIKLVDGNQESQLMLRHGQTGGQKSGSHW